MTKGESFRRYFPIGILACGLFQMPMLFAMQAWTAIAVQAGLMVGALGVLVWSLLVDRKKKAGMYRVECLDTFEGEWFGRREFATEAEATAYARDVRAEIERDQPDAGALQDRVFVTDPNNVQREVRG